MNGKKKYTNYGQIHMKRRNIPIMAIFTRDQELFTEKRSRRPFYSSNGCMASRIASSAT
jgi:hypothetical protein